MVRIFTRPSMASAASPKVCRKEKGQPFWGQKNRWPFSILQTFGLAAEASKPSSESHGSLRAETRLRILEEGTLFQTSTHTELQVRRCWRGRLVCLAMERMYRVGTRLFGIFLVSVRVGVGDGEGKRDVASGERANIVMRLMFVSWKGGSRKCFVRVVHLYWIRKKVANSRWIMTAWLRMSDMARLRELIGVRMEPEGLGRRKCIEVEGGKRERAQRKKGQMIRKI